MRAPNAIPSALLRLPPAAGAPATGAADGRSADTCLDYAQAFADYVRVRGTNGKSPPDEHSTQSFAR